MPAVQGSLATSTRQHNRVKDALIGVAVGDALGVPVEFTIREDLEIFPVKDMRGYGTHNQPPGTWSDDSSLTFCLAESLIEGYDLRDLAKRFIDWRDQAYWTAHGEVFDIGGATDDAISRLLEATVPPQQAGGAEEYDNGNGSLMRVLPLVFYHQDLPIEERFQVVKDVSSLTHGHFRSVFSCFIYLEVARCLIQGLEPMLAYETAIKTVNDWIKQSHALPGSDLRLFERTLSGDIPRFQRFQIHSSGYVIHSLEASLWCWLTTNSYEEAVLTAVNLGADTDTTGAITGGLAGLSYGYTSIPMHWIKSLVRKDDIYDLAERLHRAYHGGADTQTGMVA